MFHVELTNDNDSQLANENHYHRANENHYHRPNENHYHLEKLLLVEEIIWEELHQEVKVQDIKISID